MATAEIGALRITLAMDAGTFKRNARDAENTIARLDGRFGGLAKTVAKFAAGLGAAVAARAILGAVQSAVTLADEMGKLSQRTGIATETLSGMAYQAALSGVEFDSFTGALDRFNREIAEAAEKGAAGNRAFATMGISLRDGLGNLKDTGTLLADVADKFSTYGDSANKVAIAQELFGKSGAQLIPFLNGGREGLARAAEEAKKFGIVIDKEAAAKAEAFNDALTRLGQVSRGFATDLGSALIPALTAMLEKMMQLGAAMREGAGNTGAWLDHGKISATATAIRELQTEMGELARKRNALAESTPQDLTAMSQLDRRIGSMAAELQNLKAEMLSLTSTWQTTVAVAADAAPSMEAFQRAMEKDIADSQARAAELLRIYQERSDTLSETLAGLATPYDELIAKQLELNRAQQDGTISADAMGDANERAVAKMNAAYAGVGVSVTGALAALFNKNKNFAKADAMMRAYQAFNQALVAPPGAPWSYVNAAAALAQGMAQVRNIENTNMGGSGSGAASASAAPAAAATAPQQSTLYVEGIRSDELLRGSAVRDLAERLIQYQADGGKIVLSPA